MIYILFLYLLIKSHFVGLANTKFILIYGIPIYILIDLVLIFFLIKKMPSLIKKINILQLNRISLIMICFFIFYFFYSIFLFDTNLKDVLTNFSDLWPFILFYFLVISNIKEKTILALISFFCFAIGFFYLVFYLSGFSFGTYQEYYNTDQRVPLVFNTVFPLFFSFLSYKYLNKNNLYLSFILFFIVFILWTSGFRSLSLSIFLILFLNFCSKIKFKSSTSNFLFKYFGFIFFTFTMFYIPYYYLSNDSAIVSRFKINQERFYILNERPLFGYGFIGKDSEVGKVISDASLSRHSSTIKVVDAGYLDLLLRFGYIGTFIYLYILFKLSSLNININKIYLSDSFIISLIFINFTLSVFSFSIGLVPFFIACYVNQLQKKL